ncbi:putative short chain dehydrogenase reductase family protein [Botrytis fragariae]|uniref:Putative short chain dehydrogenase reductase family protein n=1 Tax=Botrytis fragariae TaxID=1964551 RepID=A0A8H6EMM2_9HELO|nr:putative short chain dehydrogenase reductase family protein [Botrytis fragariae]KAF5877470.1 putative short chain dehydrogenase reductase family protein [Botrytis fragariae]
MPGKYQKLVAKHVLVIGGSSGIGYCVAEASLESGASVTISSSSPDRVAKAVEKLTKSYPDGRINGFPCDLSKPSLEADVEKLFEQTGKVDHIVFTAGDALSLIPLEKASLEDMQKAGQVRFFGQLMVAKVGSRYLSEGPQASITLTTGSTADKPMKGWSIVTSFAAGLHGMARSLAVDLAPVRVNVVSPGPVKTELWNGMGQEEREKLFKEVAGNVLTKHVALPEEVAESYLWLMKDSNVTGTVVRSDSGTLLA